MTDTIIIRVEYEIILQAILYLHAINFESILNYLVPTTKYKSEKQINRRTFKLKSRL